MFLLVMHFYFLVFFKSNRNKLLCMIKWTNCHLGIGGPGERTPAHSVGPALGMRCTHRHLPRHVERSSARRPHRAGCVWFRLHSLCQSTYSLSEWPFKLELKIGKAVYWIMPCLLKCLEAWVCCFLLWCPLFGLQPNQPEQCTYPNNTRRSPLKWAETQDISLSASSKGLGSEGPGKEFVGCWWTAGCNAEAARLQIWVSMPAKVTSFGAMELLSL